MKVEQKVLTTTQRHTLALLLSYCRWYLYTRSLDRHGNFISAKRNCYFPGSLPPVEKGDHLSWIMEAMAPYNTKKQNKFLLLLCVCSYVNIAGACMQMLQRVAQIPEWCQTLHLACHDRKKATRTWYKVHNIIFYGFPLLQSFDYFIIVHFPNLLLLFLLQAMAIVNFCRKHFSTLTRLNE